VGEHDRLMAEWEQQPHHRGNAFIRDGIIDSERWIAAKRKVLFVLREAYDKKNRPEGFDLCGKIRDQWKGPRKKIWWTVAAWAYAAHQGSAQRIPLLSRKSEPDQASALLASAVANVKKSGGKSTSDPVEIGQCAKTDGQFLSRQVEIINPDIVICGGTWPDIKYLWQQDAEQVYDHVFRVKNRFFVRFWHPANRYPSRLNYYALACLLQNSGCLVG